MIGSVFVGMSVDGFIARLDDRFDFLPADGGEPHGYEEFMASVDALVIGRRTYDVVLDFGAWPYGKKPVIVLSSGAPRPAPEGAVVEHMSGAPAAIADALDERGFVHVYVDGGVTAQRFLGAGLVHRLVLTRAPVLIGEGRPLFGAVPGDIALRHVATRHFKSGLVQSEYHVEGARDPGRAIAPLWN